MGYEVKYKEINSKEYIEEQLIRIIDTVRNKGQIYAGEWAEYIDTHLKEQSSVIDEVINQDRCISITLVDDDTSCKVIFDNTRIDGSKVYRGFTKQGLVEFIEALQLVHSQLENIEVV